MIEHGIVVRGVVQPGTERVIRDSEAWWSAGRETRPRRWPVDLVCGHWTAGNCRTGPTAGRLLWRAMEARRGADGVRDLSVSIHHSISWDGLIWQHLDHEHAAVHVGHRPTIARSIGIECMWPGTAKQAARLGAEGDVVVRRWDGARVRCMQPSDEMLEAWRWLVDALSRIHEIPRVAAPSDRRLTLPELARHRGVLEHASLPGTRKVDACGLLIEATGYRAG